MLRRALLVAALGLLAAGTAAGQIARGRILGRVTDATGAVVPGVKVNATNLETGVALAAESNEQGNYALPFLDPGAYRVQAERQGFKRFDRARVEVRVGDSVTIDIGLELGGMTESVTVTTETPLLETAEATVGQLVDRKRLQELPLAGGNPLYLLQLTPGIIATNASSHGWFPHALDSISNIAAVGTRTLNNQFALDGNPIMTQNGQVSYSPPPEMVQEMKIQTAPFDAALGGFSGANFNIVTKPGTNRYHGDLWFSHYSRPLTARNFFVNRYIYDQSTGPVTEQKKNAQWPPVLTNRYRATASGPLVKNKTFLVYGFDMLDRKRPNTGTSTVPTEAQRRGDFSDLLKLGSRYQIYDPATIAPAPNGRFSRQPLAGNILPASRIDPAAKSITALFAAPNAFDNTEGRNNFIYPIGTRIDYFSHSVRLDHALSERHRLFGSFAVSNLDEPGNQRFPGSTAVGQIEDRRHRGFMLDDVSVLRPSLVLNVRYGLTRYLNSVAPLSRGYDLASIGLPPSVTGPLNPALVALPEINIQGLQTLSQGSGYRSATNYHTATAGLTQTHGNHSFRYGGEFRVYQENRAAFGNYAPHYDFLTGWTQGPLDNSPAAPIGQGMASFLLGLPTGGWKDINADYAQQSRYYGFYWQDDWKVTRTLSVNLGLRYELETPTAERYDRTVRGFDYNAVNPVQAEAQANYAKAPIAEIAAAQFRTPGGLTFASVGGQPRGLWNTDRNNFAPRLGFAWQMMPKTVWRGGYGIFYESLGASREDVNQAGFSQRTTLVPSQDNGLTFSATLRNPFPAGYLQPAGASAGLLTYVGRSPAFFDPQRRTGYMQRWSLGVQQELAWRVLLEATYVGNRGSLMGVSVDRSPTPRQYLSASLSRDQKTIDYLSFNTPNPFYGIAAFAGAGLSGRNTTRAQLLTAFPHFTGVPTTDDTGYSWYHSLQVRLERRLAQGFTLGGTYTWSKFMEAVDMLNPTDARPTEVISPQDRPHHFSMTGIWELPVGKGKRWLSRTNGWVDGVLGGWQIQGIFQLQSGPPIGFGNIIFTGDLHALPLSGSSRSVERWFNIDAGFERDAAKQLGQNLRTFPLRLSGLRSDGFQQVDFSVFKNFKLTERGRLQIRAEGQNALNTPMFGAPNTTVTATTFGQVTATQFPEQRRITLAAKLTF